MLRITTAEFGHKRRLLLGGKLLARWVPTLLAACETTGAATRLEIELSRLSFADTAGVAVLRQLAERGVSLVNLSPFLDELVRDDCP